MEEKKFNCAAEQLPIALRMALTSLKVDWADFQNFAPTVFNDAFAADCDAKIVSYEQLTKATDVQKHQKVITTQSLPATLKDLQISLNPIEGYLKLAASGLDISIDDFGLSKMREAMHSKDVAAIVSGGNSFVLHLKRNEVALTAKGMKPGTIEAVANKVAEIENLKSTQNNLKNKTGRAIQSNISAANELWDTLKIITDTGTALYKGVDAVKLKEYTVSSIFKRISNSQSKPAASDKKPDETPVAEKE